MLKNYIKIAWRNLQKNKAYTFINIGGLTIGMVVFMLIVFWVKDELTFNKWFKNYDKIAQFHQHQTFNGQVFTGAAMPRPLEFVLREEYKDHFKHIVMCSWNNTQNISFQEKHLSKAGFFIQEDGPELMSLEMLHGGRNGLIAMNSIMLSESTAKAFFGEEDPLNQILKVNNRQNVKVTGVYKDLPSEISFGGGYATIDYLMPWKLYASDMVWVKNARNSWGNNSFQIFVQVADNTTVETVSEIVKDIKYNKAGEDVKSYKPALFLMPMKDWYLRSNYENGKLTGGRIIYVKLFGIIGVFILLLACVNFMNLSTARSEKRAKEVGVRKSIGSQRIQLIAQFLGESFFIVLISYVAASCIVLLVLKEFNVLTEKAIQFPWTDVVFWLYSLAFIGVTTLLSGFYPALYLSAFKPVAVLKGTFQVGKYSMLPRKILVVFQFTVSVVFIVGTMVVLQQIEFAKNRPTGYNKSGLIQIPSYTRDFLGKENLMRSEFLESGAVTHMTTSTSPLTAVYSNQSGFEWEGKPDGFQDDFAWIRVTHDYVETLGLKVIEGRGFSREYSTDSTGVLINKTAVRYMGIKDPIGKYIRMDREKIKMKIIGVVDDMIAQSPYRPVKQAMYPFNKEGDLGFYNLRLNPKKSTRENLALIEKVFKKHFPSTPFDYDFIDENYKEKFRTEERVFSLASLFTFLAIAISCLGLLGLISFVAEKRTKEIGVRKVLGASVFKIWQMLSKEFIYLVLISCVIAIPLSYFLMINWLENFQYRTTISLLVFLQAIGGAVIITLLTVSFHAIRVAQANPIKSLKTE